MRGPASGPVPMSASAEAAEDAVMVAEAPGRPAARPADLDTGPSFEPTPAHVASEATEMAMIRLHELSLIGLIQRPDGPMALLRRPDGAILRAGVGEEIGDERVVVIGDTGVVLVAEGERRTLTLPQS